jgi:hypothetical protein
MAKACCKIPLPASVPGFVSSFHMSLNDWSMIPSIDIAAEIQGIVIALQLQEVLDE